jgi:DNA invertase Pin-like site-specific DNA recombinase
MKKETRVCAFIRTSTLQQDYSRQIRDLQIYCKHKGYTIVKTIATKISGAKIDRPDILELIRAAKAGEFDKVAVTEISRLGRDVRQLQETIRLLHSLKIAIVFQNLGIESLNEKNEEHLITNLIISIYSELAAEERRLLSMRVRSGMAMAKAKGIHIGRRPDTKEDKEKLLKKYPKLVNDLHNGLSIRKAERLHNISRGTVIKIKKLLAN